jgi:dipeptidase
MVSHSGDDELGDHSLAFVPSRTYNDRNRFRNVYAEAVALGEIPALGAKSTPHLNVDDKGPDEDFGAAEPRTVPIGKIDVLDVLQSALNYKSAYATYVKTHEYLDGVYGIVNDAGLAFGECTDGTLFQCWPMDDEDCVGEAKRLFYSSELSRVALELTDNCRDAIKVMGYLVEKYGYWGTGETLPLADGDEAWVFEVAPGKDGFGGYWVAKKVPDDGVFWAGNEFRIRDVPFECVNQFTEVGPYEMICGSRLFVDFGVDDGKGEKKSIDWLPTVSKGEYNHPYYSLRRAWRGLNLMNPDWDKMDDSWYDSSTAYADRATAAKNPWSPGEDELEGLTRAYPFAVKVRTPKSWRDIAAVHRDHYEGTEFDLTKGLTAGPWGNPHRANTHGFDLGGDVGEATDLKGAWERPICHYYIGYAYVVECGPKPICLLAHGTPGESLFVPLAVGKLPKGYAKVSTHKFNLDEAWWVYNRVEQMCEFRYCYAIDDVKKRQELDELETISLCKNWIATLPFDAAKERIRLRAEELQARWKQLYYDLIVRYNQMFYNVEQDEPNTWAFTLGYPETWLTESTTEWLTGPKQYSKVPDEKEYLDQVANIVKAGGIESMYDENGAESSDKYGRRYRLA